MIDRPAAAERCPCQSGQPYGDCCGPAHDGSVPAGTAEALMRSRYCAFVILDADYLLRTWDVTTRPLRLELDVERRWRGLEIVGKTGGGPFDGTGTVDFRARYRDANRSGTHAENSEFVRSDTRWVYLGRARSRPGQR